MIESIEEGQLGNSLNNLTGIQLRVNSIKGSPFSNMVNLEEIWLFGNLSQISSNTLKIGRNDAIKEVLYIRMWQNQLNGSTFEAGSFTSPELSKRNVVLDFSSNPIKYLNETVFLPFLKSNRENQVIVQKTPFECKDERNAWICKQSGLKEQILFLPCKLDCKV